MQLLRFLLLLALFLFLIHACGRKQASGIAKTEPCFQIYGSDTINATDGDGRKQGHWIVFADALPGSTCPNLTVNSFDSLSPGSMTTMTRRPKLEEGFYRNNKREGDWTYYAKDGSVEKTIAFNNDIAQK